MHLQARVRPGNRDPMFPCLVDRVAPRRIHARAPQAGLGLFALPGPPVKSVGGPAALDALMRTFGVVAPDKIANLRIGIRKPRKLYTPEEFIANRLDQPFHLALGLRAVRLGPEVLHLRTAEGRLG